MELGCRLTGARSQDDGHGPSGVEASPLSLEDEALVQSECGSTGTGSQDDDGKDWPGVEAYPLSLDEDEASVNSECGSTGNGSQNDDAQVLPGVEEYLPSLGDDIPTKLCESTGTVSQDDDGQDSSGFGEHHRPCLEDDVLEVATAFADFQATDDNQVMYAVDDSAE